VIDQARAEYLEHQRHEDRFRRAREREQLPEALEKANRILGLDLTLEQVQIEGPYIYFDVEGHRFRCGGDLADAWLHLQMTCPVCEQTFYSEAIHSLQDLGQVLEVQVGKRPCPQDRESDEDEPQSKASCWNSSSGSVPNGQGRRSAATRRSITHNRRPDHTRSPRCGKGRGGRVPPPAGQPAQLGLTVEAPIARPACK